MTARRRILSLAFFAILSLLLVRAVVGMLSLAAGSIHVERGDLVTSVEVTGALRAVETSALGPPQVRDVWQFKIAMMADEGTEVVAGQPILAFDASELQQRLQSKSADRHRASRDQGEPC